MSTHTDLRPDARAPLNTHGPQPVHLIGTANLLPASEHDPTTVYPAPGHSTYGPPSLGPVLAAAAAVRGHAGRALTLAAQLGESAPRIGAGDTAGLFTTLASLAAVDLTAARVAEAHLDALSILAQAEIEPGDLFPATDASTSVWGVFAAEAGGMRLTATRWNADSQPHSQPDLQTDLPNASRNASPPPDAGWRLDGTKPWCSLAGSLSHALVTARTSDTQRRLFAVDLRQPGVGVRAGGWVALGLPSVSSGPVDFAAVSAHPIGVDGWYLNRPGFAWGGIGVAACWWGGAVGVARQLFESARRPSTHTPDQVVFAHLGAIDVLLTACATTLGQAASAIDSGAATGQAGSRLAARVRGLVARSTEEVLSRVGHALGPGPLAFDARHAQRVADLQLYVRQHHAERDDATLGRMLLAPGARRSLDAEAGAPW